MPGSERRIRERRTFRFPAPPPSVYPKAASMPGSPSQLLSRLGPAASNGLSLSRSDPRFRKSRPGVIVPGLLLHRSARRFLRPFGLWLRRPWWFAPPRAASSLEARCAFHDWRARLRLPLPLPFGTLTSRRIKAFRSFCRQAVRLPIRPISLRSPLRPLSLVSASDHRSRSATIRRLAVPQTSWNLTQNAPVSRFRQD